MRKYLIAFLPVFPVILTCTSVSDPVSSTPPESWPVTVYVEAEKLACYEAETLPCYNDIHYELTVYGEGALMLETNPVTVGDCIMVNVPAGKARLFQCRRYSYSGTGFSDTGSVVADVNKGLNTVFLKLSPIAAPVITSQPENFLLTYRGSAWFTVTAEGLNCFYKWQRNGFTFFVQSDPYIYVGGLERSDSGSTFRCIVCNPSGCDTSSEAVLSVLPDTVPPEIILLDSSVVVYLDSAYEDNGVFAYDSFEAGLNCRIIRTGTVNTAQAGTYTITYSVADSSGNVATATRTVTVRPFTEKDLSIPVLSLSGPDTFDYLLGINEFEFRDSGIYAYDREDGDITGRVVVTSWIPVYGSFFYCTYNVTDSDGNPAKTRYRFFNYDIILTPPVRIHPVITSATLN